MSTMRRTELERNKRLRAVLFVALHCAVGATGYCVARHSVVLGMVLLLVSVVLAGMFGVVAVWVSLEQHCLDTLDMYKDKDKVSSEFEQKEEVVKY